ncbi:hypothetical protein MAR_021430 [Mya arenaria]|uniref:Uncharacterized protein n=1 Tax=Mya arenaria TaxID=6604 RepID=A0ABY7EBL3_MYAAR|nr:hypothetical protein MAR_021430 [Mya arenaria]
MEWTHYSCSCYRSVKENPGHNAAKADADVPTDTSVYDALKAGDNGPDNSHVYMPLDVSITKAQVYNENVEKDDPVYNNTVLQNPFVYLFTD